jgi:regulator of sigma E protease
LVLSFLIFFHELGHFLVARYFGVRVDKFSIGFGKKIWSKKYGDTEYILAMIPLGGYVQMKGQDDLDPTKRSDDTDSYNNKRPWQRICILLAGPFANFLIAAILYLMIGFMGERVLVASVGKVVDNSPAHKAGLVAGDKIVSINAQPIRSWDEMAKAIKTSEGSLLLHVQRGNLVLQKRLTPKISEAKSIFGEDIKKRMIGISPKGEVTTIYHTGFDSITFAIDKTAEASMLIVKGIQKLIEGVVPANQIGGVISIMQVTSKASEVGLVALFTFTALISVNLGVLNLLPIPALDGGHIIFNLYEMITRKIPSMEVVYRLTIMGWVLLLGLMALGLYNDINRLLH